MAYKCMHCEKPFDYPITIDEGIGSYEYWGATGVHEVLVDVSPCCEDGFTYQEDEE